MPPSHHTDVIQSGVANRIRISAGENPCLSERGQQHWIIRQYDHEVQAGSVVKPLVDVVRWPQRRGSGSSTTLTSKRGIVISCGMNPRLGD